MEQPMPKYIVAGSLAATFSGPAIDMRDTNGELNMTIVTTATGTPNGLISLQSSQDGSTGWKDISGAFTQLPASAAAALTAQDRNCFWSGLKSARYVRLQWTRASGGTGATIDVAAYAR